MFFYSQYGTFRHPPNRARTLVRHFQQSKLKCSNATACVQSAVVPEVTSALTGKPRASTAKCTFVLSPLLFPPFPGCRPSPLRHGGVPCSRWHQSSTIQVPVHHSKYRGLSAKCLCCPTGENVGKPCPTCRIQAVNHATALPFVKSRKQH